MNFPVNRYDLIIFDCDGVLVDSEPISARIFAEHLRAVGLPMTSAEVDRRFRGRSMETCLKMVEARRGEPLPGTFLADMQRDTFEAYRTELRAVEGVTMVLDALRVPVCVASSGEHEKMRLTLGLTGLWPRFEGRVFSASEVERGKPSPDLFLHAASRMDVEPSRCAVVEDSLPGVEAGVAAGMQVYGHAAVTDEESLRAAGARTFRQMSDLLDLLVDDLDTEKPGA